MEKKTAIIIGLVVTIVLLGSFNFHQAQIQQETQIELDQTKLYYSFAMDMVDGFFHDRDGTEKQIKAINENPLQTI